LRAARATIEPRDAGAGAGAVVELEQQLADDFAEVIGR
jgi:hypothetical protein